MNNLNFEFLPVINYSRENFLFHNELSIDQNLNSDKINFSKNFFTNLKTSKSRNLWVAKLPKICHLKTHFSCYKKKITNFQPPSIFRSRVDLILKDKKFPMFTYNSFLNLILVNEFKKHIEIVISTPPQKKIPWKNLEFEYLPHWFFSSLKAYLSFNWLQLRLFPFFFASDSDLLIGAPTGSGKTILIIFSILRLIVNSIQLKISGGKIMKNFIKILYIAPMKALIKEVIKNIGNCFMQLGITVYEITGDTIVNINELNMSNIVIGTPEKIEILLNKREKIEFFDKIRLLIVDEIHFLGEERGAVLENILIYFKKNFIKKKKVLRIVALSATIPNFYDLSKFLNINISNGVFYFGPFKRENILNQVLIGVKFENYTLYNIKLLNSILIQKTLSFLKSASKPRILIFVQSRNDTYKTGLCLTEELERKKNLYDSRNFDFFDKKRLKQIPYTLERLLKRGIGIHHSGLSKKEKTFMEKSFKSKILPILISTSTLAWGVNLNATHVIIKGTKIYSPKKTCWEEISGTNIIQMLGRIGRYDSGKNNASLLITMSKNIERYLKLIKNRTPVESTLLNRLPDYLNIEIVSERIVDFSGALEWFSETFLWIRIRRLLSKKGKLSKCTTSIKLQLTIRSFFISQSLNELSSSGLIKIWTNNDILSSTVYGNISAFYHINYQTFLELISKLSPDKKLSHLLNLLSSSTEFNSFYPKNNEDLELFRLSKIISVPVGISSKTKEYKINILLQSYIENIRIKNSSLLSDSTYVCKNILKLSRVIFELSILQKWACMTQISFDLFLAIKNRGWYYREDIWKSVKGTVCKKYSEILRKKNVGFPSVQNLKSNEIKHFINSKKGTMEILESCSFFPVFDLEFSIQPITKFTLKLNLKLLFSILNLEYFKKRSTGMWIFIEDQICDNLVYVKYLGLIDLNKEKDFEISIIIPIFENPVSPFYLLRFRFDNYFILNTEYLIDLMEISYPLNNPMETLTTKNNLTSFSRFLIGFRGSFSLKEYFLSHILKFDHIFSDKMHICLKGGQNKILGLFEKKSKNLFQELSIIVSFLMKKLFRIFVSNNGTESVLLKRFQLKKNSNGIMGIPIEKITKLNNGFISETNRKRKIFLVKNLEIFSILKSLDFYENKKIILIIDFIQITPNLEAEPSLELVLEVLTLEKNLKKISSIIITISKILNIVDVTKILKSKNLYKAFISRKLKSNKSIISLLEKKPMNILNYKKLKSRKYKIVKNFNPKKFFLKKKTIFFGLNLENLIKNIIKFIFQSGIFFFFDYDKLSPEKFINFYITTNFISSKSHKFFLSLGLGLHDFNLNNKKRKLTEELDLIGFYKNYWLSVASISKIPVEKFYCLSGILDRLVFPENQFKFSFFIFNVLSDRCGKIFYRQKIYLSKKMLENSFDFPIESSWKNFFLEKGNIFFDYKCSDYFFKEKLKNILGFFFIRVMKNPRFYLGSLKRYKRITYKKIAVILFLKLKKNKIIYQTRKNFFSRTLKGITMKKFFQIEATVRSLMGKFFEKNIFCEIDKNFINFKNSPYSNPIQRYIKEYLKNLYENPITDLHGPRFFLSLTNNRCFVSTIGKKIVYYLIILAYIFDFSGYLSYILLHFEKMREIINKNSNSEFYGLKIWDRHQLTTFLIIKIHNISSYKGLYNFLNFLFKKRFYDLKLSSFIKKIRKIKLKVKWNLSFWTKKKNDETIVTLILDQILSWRYSKKEHKNLFLYKNDYYSSWILIGNNNSDKIIGRYRLDLYQNNKFQFQFSIFKKIMTMKIFIIYEEFSDFDAESNFNF